MSIANKANRNGSALPAGSGYLSLGEAPASSLKNLRVFGISAEMPLHRMAFLGKK